MSTTFLVAGATFCFAGAAGLAAYGWRSHVRGPTQRLPAVQAAPPAPRLRQGQLPVLSGATLLAQSGMSGTLAQIRERSGLAAANFERDLQPVIEAVAAFVQRLPASESHHHAQPGGLLVHMIEVADAALRLRAGRVLPVGAAIEQVARLQHRWTYAVCLAALLHDIGRPMADLRIQYFKTPEGAPVPWMPLAGSLEAHGAAAYTVDFPSSSERDYLAHQRLPVILMQQLVPRATLMWLAEDGELIRELNAFLSGQPLPKSAIAEIVVAADQASVKANLVTGPRTRFRTARAVPLIERLMRALRRMLVDGTLTLNQTGFAAGWSDAECLWLVPKTVADAVRGYLEREETGESAGAGIPTDNNRLFDTWQEYGAVRPNAKGSALWDIEVRSGDQVKTLNALCFPLEKLYAEATLYPKPFAGEIRVLGATSDTQVDTAAEAGNSAPADGASLPALAAPVTEPAPGAEAAAPLPTAGASTGATASTVPSDRPVAIAPGAHDDQLEPVVDDNGAVSAPTPSREAVPAAVSDPPPALGTSSGSNAAVPAMRQSPANLRQLLASSAPAVAPVDPYASMHDPLKVEGHPVAAKLMHWLQQGVASGTIPFNNTGSFVHFVAEGMLLVSPIAFKQFQKEHGVDGEGAGRDDENRYVIVQRALMKSGWARRSGKKDYLHTYVVDGGRSPKSLTCFLVADPQRWFQPVPAANPVLRREDRQREGFHEAKPT